jgi:hypothetical protein
MRCDSRLARPIAKALEIRSLEVIEEALGADAASILPARRRLDSKTRVSLDAS